MSGTITSSAKNFTHWRTRLAAAGFCFFLLKGLAWLSLPLLAKFWLIRS